MKATSSDHVYKAATLLIVGVLALITLFPLLLTVSVSLQTMNEVYAHEPVIIPAKPAFSNYATALTTGSWLRYFKNSALVTLVTVLISLIINSMAGYAFARISFKGRNVLFALILLGMMVPTQVTLIPVFSLLRHINAVSSKTGLINTFPGLVIPYIAGSFGVFLCRQFYVSFPQELDDAAMMDGCGRIRAYINIYLPLSGPVLASLGVLKFTGTWNEYTWPLVATNGEKLKTVQLALTSFRDEGEIYWNLLMAATLTVSLPIYAVFMFAQKHFVSGLLAGSVKA
ncbi:MAG: carbohydrate ABC transporter permease [Clostridia bacterium]|nr:carbohydrate ABC transporter permease [Clostridia bacterium]